MRLVMRYVGTLVFCAAWLLVPAWTVGGDFLVPDELRSGDYEFSIDTIFYDGAFKFTIHGPWEGRIPFPEGRASVRDGGIVETFPGGELKLIEGWKLNFRGGVGPVVYDGELMFTFRVAPHLIQESEFMFSWRGMHRIRLSDWVPEGDLFSAAIMFHNSPVYSGGSIDFDFVVTPQMDAVLEFRDSCIVRSELRDESGAVVETLRQMCNMTAFAVPLAGGEHRRFRCSVPVSVPVAGESELSPLPAGRYMVYSYVPGYREFALADSAWVEVVVE